MHRFRFEHLESKCLLTGLPQLVADISVETDVDLSGSFAAPDRLYFYSSEKQSGRELWETNGTAEGTRLVNDFAAGPTDALADLWGEVGNVRLFASGYELWAVPETGNPQLLQSGVHHNYGGSSERLYFGKGLELWVTDGTEAGTYEIDEELKTLEAVASKIGEVLLRTLHGEYYHSDGSQAGTTRLFANFTARRFVSGSQPAVTIRATSGGWMIRGTERRENSQPIREGLLFTDGTAANTNLLVSELSGDIKFLAESQGRTLMSLGSWEFATTDGTTAGTQIVSRQFSGFAGANQRGFFVTQDSQEETSLWMLNHQSDNPVTVKVITTHRSSLRPLGDLANDRFLFSALSSDGSSVWISDGTANGTLALPIPISRLARIEITHEEHGGAFALQVTDGEETSVWITDGTAENTWLVKSAVAQDVRPEFGTRTLQPRIVANNSFFFTEQVDDRQILWEVNVENRSLIERQVADEFAGFHRVEGGVSYLASHASTGVGSRTFALWQVSLEGNDRAPQVIRVLNSTTADSDLGQYVPFRDRILFVKDGSEVWQSDGTSEGTTRIDEGIPTLPIPQMLAGQDHVYFLRESGLSERDIWRTNDKLDGVELVEANVAFATELTSVNGKLYLTTLVPGRIWEIDQATGHRTEVVPNSGDIVRLNDREFLVTHSRIVNSETGESRRNDFLSDISDAFNFGDRIAYNSGGNVWATDGTREQTLQLAPGKARSFLAVEDKLYFAMQNTVYLTDGTTAGTSMLPLVLPAEATIDSMHFVGDSLLVIYRLPLAGRACRELVAFRDGSTHHLLSLPTTSFNHVVVDNELYFSMGDELWKTDGFKQGTQQVLGVFPVNRRTLPGERNDIVIANDELFFVADDGLHGEELWKLPLNRTTVDGDVNGDGIADFADFSVLLQNFGDSVFPLESGDLDGNGRVDFSDFLLLSAAYWSD